MSRAAAELIIKEEETKPNVAIITVCSDEFHVQTLERIIDFLYVAAFISQAEISLDTHTLLKWPLS